MTATVHVDARRDVVGGVTLGVNSLFDFRGRAPSYIARTTYWLQSSRRTKLVGTYYSGPQPIAAARGHIGRWQSKVELQLVHDVNRRLTLVSETNLGWDTRDPANELQTSRWCGSRRQFAANAEFLGVCRPNAAPRSTHTNAFRRKSGL